MISQKKSSENIRIFFRHGFKDTPIPKADNPEFKHQVMQLQGVVDVAPDGKTVQGRWYGFGANAFPAEGGKVNPGWMNGVYEVEYLKQDTKPLSAKRKSKSPTTIGEGTYGAILRDRAYSIESAGFPDSESSSKTTPPPL